MARILRKYRLALLVVIMVGFTASIPVFAQTTPSEGATPFTPITLTGRGDTIVGQNLAAGLYKIDFTPPRTQVIQIYRDECIDELSTGGSAAWNPTCDSTQVLRINQRVATGYQASCIDRYRRDHARYRIELSDWTAADPETRDKRPPRAPKFTCGSDNYWFSVIEDFVEIHGSSYGTANVLTSRIIRVGGDGVSAGSQVVHVRTDDTGSWSLKIAKVG